MLNLLRRNNKTYKKVNMIFLVVFAGLISFIAVGYSALNQSLMVGGDVNYYTRSQKLYDVLKRATGIGTYAREYTGTHQDSFAGNGTEKIYHWYGSTDANGTAIQNMNNVIFAGQCWQMIRTTDTGGVKMIYNGEAENNQCLNTRENHIGYSSRTSYSMSTTYYYGTSYEYDSTNKVFSLSGNVTTGTIKVGQYTCRNTSSTGTCTTLYYVDTLDSGTNYFVIPLNSNSHYSQFGTLQYNNSDTSIAQMGYMYNEIYPSIAKAGVKFYISNSDNAINTNYYYSSTISYNGGQYTLTNPSLISSLSDYNDLVGKYVISSSGVTSSSQVNYVVAVSNNRMYIKNLTGGDLNTSLTLGNSYTKSGGVYTLSGNVTNISYIDWFNSSSLSSYAGKYTCDGNNTSCTNLKHITSEKNPSNNFYYAFGVNDLYSYAESVSYNNGTYTLTGDIKQIWDVYDPANQTILSTHHYTCFEEGTSCTAVKYVILLYVSDWVNSIYSIQLTGVQNIETALNNMLYASNVNTINSTIKTGIDAWYVKYLDNYDNYLEDTIFCNNRTIYNNGAWNANGGTITNVSTSYLAFKIGGNNYSTDISCDRTTDQFSTLNSSAQLTYKVGLLSNEEINLVSNNNARKTGQYYWINSPHYYAGVRLNIRAVNGYGITSNYYGNNSIGVRPSISLKPGIEYISGDGSMASPYIVEADPVYPTFTLTYNNNGGDGCEEDTTLQNTAWGSLCSPGRTDYLFNGWNTAQDGTGTTITSSTIATGDLIVYAQWILISQKIWDFAYTGSAQTFTAPYTGDYRIQLWGAAGAGSSDSGGRGAYVYGNIPLTQGETLYVYVGGGGTNRWNGGGTSSGDGGSSHYGGGATDVRLVSAAWNNATGLRSRIMVAGGGGGLGSTYRWGGKGGLTSGGTGLSHSKKDDCETISTTGGAGGTQTSGYQFGVGGNASNENYPGGTGGGGYWGGKGGQGKYKGTECTSTGLKSSSGGGGGSSFISGAKGYIAVISSGSNSPRLASDGTTTCTQTIANTDEVCSYHYSGKIFNTTGGTAGGNTSTNGRAKFTFLDTFTITYDNNGGSGCTSLTQEHDVEWGELCVPTRSGYTFQEWNTKADGTGTTILGSQLARNNVTVYAIWQGAGPIWNYSYTGSKKTFRAPTEGTYKIELWGAAGAGSSESGGRGAYTYGDIHLAEGEMIYIYVGGGGSNRWNGGGTSSGDSGSSHYGGGATDVRLVSGSWNNTTGLRSRIMVAGGGGGLGSTYRWGGKGGLTSGGTGLSHSKTDDCETISTTGGVGGTQTTGYQFGVGGDANNDNYSGGAGGGGYWGGKGGQGKYKGNECTSTGLKSSSGGGGGSSYISGAMGYIAVISSGSNSPRLASDEVTTCTQTIANTDVVCSYHYSGKTFDNAGGTAGGNTSTNGRATITLLS